MSGELIVPDIRDYQPSLAEEEAIRYIKAVHRLLTEESEVDRAFVCEFEAALLEELVQRGGTKEEHLIKAAELRDRLARDGLPECLAEEDAA